MKKHFPNFLTCLNLFSGCLAIVMVFRNHMEWAACFIVFAAVFDFFDGLVARWLNVQSAYGRELDSMADMVSFGFVPGMVLFKMLQVNAGQLSDHETAVRALQFVPFMVTVFSGLRLAKFNLDTRQTHSFIGLPTPANTLFVVSLPMILLHDEFGLQGLLLNPYFIVGISVLQSFLLVSELPFIALKFRTFSWKDNQFQYLLLAGSGLLLLTLKYAALPLIIFLYVLLSFVKTLIQKK